jgi:ABC-2 type transport system ATP-binding protein
VRLRLEGVGRRYGARGPWVLKDVDLEVGGGTLLRVEGANGTGKSTFLRIVAGIDRPSAGRVSGRGRTAYVPERFPAALPFSTHGYLVHLGRIQGLGTATASRRADHWLERFGIGAYGGTPMDQLSKGTSQKAAVAQAFLAEPQLLVLDEAWTGLDHDARTLLDDEVRSRVAAGGTVVFVDHDPRRLAGEATAAHRVAGGRVTVVGGATAVGDRVAGRVLVEATGSGEPPVLPGGVVVEEPVVDGLLRLAVPADESDAVLRALLAARPPWHIRAVRPEAGGR